MDEKTVYDPLVAMDKATGDGAAVGAGGGAGVVIGGVVVATLRAHGLAAWPLGLDGAVVGLVATGLAAGVATVKRFLRNRKKHKFGLVVLALLCLGAVGSGCETTTSADGTVVERLDLRGLEEAYRLYTAERSRERDAPPPPPLVIEGVQIDFEDVVAELERRKRE